jgi:hypothetical protein
MNFFVPWISKNTDFNLDKKSKRIFENQMHYEEQKLLSKKINMKISSASKLLTKFMLKISTESKYSIVREIDFVIKMQDKLILTF